MREYISGYARVYVIVYSVICALYQNKGELCVDPLTPPVSLLHVPYDPLCGLETLAHVLAAVDATANELKEYDSHPNKRSHGPYFCAI